MTNGWLGETLDTEYSWKKVEEEYKQKGIFVCSDVRVSEFSSLNSLNWDIWIFHIHARMK